MSITLASGQTAKVNAFVDQQNLVRGSISALRRKWVDESAVDPYRRFRSALAKDLLTARHAIEPAHYDGYLEWYHNTIRNVVPDHFQRPIGFDFLGGLHLKVPKMSLEREVEWITKRIAHENETINKFRDIAGEIEFLVTQGDYDQAIEFIKSASTSFGETYWGVQLRIALEHASGGLEAHKQYLSILKAAQMRGLLSFVSFYTSVRNEDRTTWIRFVESFERRLSKTKYDGAVQSYLRFRLIGVWPSLESGLADVLRIEQCHSIIDIYETLIGLLQHLLTSSSVANAGPIVDLALSNLSSIHDFRLDKLALAVGSQRRGLSLPCRKGTVSGALFEGRLKNALRESKSLKAAETIDPWQIIYLSAVHAHRRNFATKSLPKLNTIPLMASIFRRDASCISALDQLLKVSHNLIGLPYAAGLLCFSRTFFGNTKQDLRHIGAAGLNSPFLGYEDLDYIQGNTSSLLAYLFQHHCHDSMSSSWKVLLSGSPNQEDAISTYFQAVYLYRASLPSKAIAALDTIPIEQASEPVRLLFARLKLACLDALNERGAIIELVASEAAGNEIAPALLPIADTLASYTWADYRPKANTLKAGIALDALWRATDEDEVATTLRYAFQYQLKKSGCSRPSEFADCVDRYDRSDVVYYLRNICIPSVMDMSKAFKTSSDVLDERRSVCAALKALDPDRSDEYDAEIYRLTNNKVISDGLRLVDRSRIHVDTDALTRWASKTIKEDFVRYQDLVQAGVGSKSDFDEILRDVFSSIGARQVFFTPDDQSDGLLVDIFMRLREEFLTNSDYGLDYFLSKRVRHQSFIGLIRGPLEFDNLITARETEFGPYRRNDILISRLASLSSDQQDEVHKILCSFSEAFDEALIKVKDNQFQILSSDKPLGVFDIPVTNHMMFVARSLAQSGVGFDDFLSMMFMLFWTALDPSLQQARKLVSEELKLRVSGMFDKLRADLRVVAENDLFFTSLSTTIGNVSAEVQRSLDSAADWFVRPDGRKSNHTFTLQQSIDIAVESALKSHRAFDPDMKALVRGDADLQVPDLVLLTDAIFVALDNVKWRSGIKKNASVWINCDVSEDDGCIHLNVRSQVAPGIRNPDAEKKLQEIRELIQAGHVGKRARKEGGSGLLKLAAALRHSAGGSLSFGFLDDQEFELSLRLKATQFTVAVIG